MTSDTCRNRPEGLRHINGKSRAGGAGAGIKTNGGKLWITFRRLKLRDAAYLKKISYIPRAL
jgi:hypothetical protein